MVNDDEQDLPLPLIRCLSKAKAAEYLGIGITLLAELQIPSIKFGRRIVYDRIDLDGWLEDYKQCERRRVGKDLICTNSKKDSTGGKTLATGGLVRRSRTACEYAKVLGLKPEVKQRLI